ncbi:right-handed parallel beta-helix repeat-containing protein [Dyadobacter sp. 3J3]|uniref:right-handed parallel beta-helix repeat-containing protein n=1 Tax=Dyadobacter sp. 3J3 TaxID=2606600 RepID=UPI00135B6975|nr:right-handed parallel beta-helix repeat-containing protein [Dyadobacter sp. 3J3]
MLASHNLYSQKVVEYYVSKSGLDKASGTIKDPFNSILKAQEQVRHDRLLKNTNFRIILREGIYELNKPLTFNTLDGSDSNYETEYIAFSGEKVSISGGRQLKGNWVMTKNKNIWKLKIDGFTSQKDKFRSLFIEGTRLKRASSDTLFSKGPLPGFPLIKRNDFNALSRLIKDSIEVFCGFSYDNHSLDQMVDLSSAEVIVYNSWEASWHSIRKLDKENQYIYFRNPATYPVGFYSNKVPYRVENSKDFLDSPGEWILDYSSGEVFYFVNKNENPNKLKFTIPVLDKLVTIKGYSANRRYVSNIKFENIDFIYSKSAWGVNGIPKIDKAINLQKFSWIRFNEGFSSNQTAIDCGEAILMQNASNCSFINCSFSHLGNYAIRIGEFSKSCIIQNCNVWDNGGGGVIVGFNLLGGKKRNLSEQISPSYNKIINCNIYSCGVVFPSAVGIGVMQANNTIIESNTITDLPYTGISVGWTFSEVDNYTFNNSITDNQIAKVMTVLADGGGIYTLGKQTGSVYKRNIIRDVFRSNRAIGSFNNGFFFDQGSSDFLVDSNVVFNIKNQDYRFNKTDSSKIIMGINYFEKTGKNKDLLTLKKQNIK